MLRAGGSILGPLPSYIMYGSVVLQGHILLSHAIPLVTIKKLPNFIHNDLNLIIKKMQNYLENSIKFNILIL